MKIMELAYPLIQNQNSSTKVSQLAMAQERIGIDKKIIEVYGWNIHENGEPGKGAKFILSIPTD